MTDVGNFRKINYVYGVKIWGLMLINVMFLKWVRIEDKHENKK